MTDQGLLDCFFLLLGMFSALAFIAGFKAAA
jgi:hypothetical protein